MSHLFHQPREVALSSAAVPVSGALAYFYDAGTTTPRVTYTTAALGVAHAHPVVASSVGVFAPIYLSETGGAYKVDMKTPAGVSLSGYPIDNLQVAPDATALDILAEDIAPYLRPLTDAEDGASVTDYTFAPGHLFRYLTTAQRADFEAHTLTVDLAVPLQTWATVSVGLIATFPAGSAKTTAPINLTGNNHLKGASSLSRIVAYGCNAFNITVGRATVEGIVLYSYSADGTSTDPRTWDAISCNGTAIAQVNSCTFRDLLFAGWNRCINLAYTWTSHIENCESVNVNIGVRLFGQSVNNTIANSKLVCTSGVAAIQTVKDGTTQGEGLLVTNTLLVGGSAFISDGFLGVGFCNCMPDLLTGTGFDMTGVKAFTFDGPWINAVNRCFDFKALGAAEDIDASIKVGLATTSGADSVIVIGANNKGVKILGSTILKSSASGGSPIHIAGSSVSVIGNHIRNGSSASGVYAGGADIHVSGNTGDTSVQWVTSQIKSVASAPTVALPAPTGAAIQFITVTGTININSLNDAAAWAGKMLVLKFAGALTVVDGIGINIGTDFVTAADATLTLGSDGAKWVQLGRATN